MNGSIQIKRDKYYAVVRFSDKAILHGALAEAYKKDMIAANPADKVTLPRKKKLYGQSYSVEEVQRLLSVLNDDPIRPAVILAVMYGLRRSEAVGLRWKDIDFKNKTMTICNTATRMATVHELEETKNESSHRTLPLIPGTEEYLQSLRREQKETMLLCGNRFDDSCHVCTWPDGRSLQPDYVSQHFKQVLKKNNFRVIRYHDLRHPYVKHTTKIFSLRLMDFQAQAYPDARRKTRGACQLHRGGQSRSPVRPLCNRKRFSCLPPQAKMSWILYAISMRLSGYTSTRSISSSASSVVSVSASKIALDASLRLSCRACSSCFCFACANTAA